MGLLIISSIPYPKLMTVLAIEIPIVFPVSTVSATKLAPVVSDSY